jgi:hypothetical protein
MNVLLLGRKRDLEPCIVEALERAGHTVQFPSSREEALAFIGALCLRRAFLFSSDGTIEELIELLKQASPTRPIIAISENNVMDWKFEPARTLQLRQGPEALVSALSFIERRARITEKRDQARPIRSQNPERRYSDKPSEA